jgi:hypothetical protein
VLLAPPISCGFFIACFLDNHFFGLGAIRKTLIALLFCKAMRVFLFSLKYQSLTWVALVMRYAL